MAGKVGEWAGLPVPVDKLPLVVEPSYPFAEIYATDPEPPPEGVRYINHWWSRRYRAYVYMWEEDGKIIYGPAPTNQLDHIIGTMDASHAWGIEQEHHAMKLLGTLLRHHMFKCYCLTGTFMETSKRTGLTYVFRRLRPTIVLTPHGRWDWTEFKIHNGDGQRMRILTTLCLHPIGYYQESWGGAMCPTDDVIAHLMLMRGDEPMLWRRSNQHAAHRPEAGLG